MRTQTTADGIKVTYPNADIWKAERQIITCERVSGSVSKVQLRTSPNSTILATYTLDTAGKVVIDVSDYIRSLASTQTPTLAIQTPNNNYVSMAFRVVGLINPATMIIPAHGSGLGGTIIPPRRILGAFAVGSTQAFEIRTANNQNTTVQYCEYAGAYNPEEDVYTVPIVNNRFTLTPDTYWMRITRGVASEYIRIEEPECGRKTCNVTWTSRTGVQRTSTFYLIKQKLSAADTIALQTMTDGYEEIKGSEDEVTVMIDKLDTYDYWYYSDLVAASGLVTLDDSSGFLKYAKVTTNAATIPDSDQADGRLEITLKITHYDAVVM